VLSAYVRGCGGTTEEWEERWRSLTSAQTLPLLAARPAGSSTAASAGARIGSISPAADTPDPSIIMAALDRVAEGMAVGNPAAEPTVWETTTTRAAGAESATGAAEVVEAKAAEAGAPDAGRAAVTPTRSAAATPASAMPAVADVPASASVSTTASGRFVSGWLGPAPSRTTILAAIAVVMCVLVAALAIFA
jgi:hypothetical protein